MKKILFLMVVTFIMMPILFFGITIYGLNNKDISRDAVLNLTTTSYMLGCVNGSDSITQGNKLRYCIKGAYYHRKDIEKIIR